MMGVIFAEMVRFTERHFSPRTADWYGYWLSTRFVDLYPEMLQGYSQVRVKAPAADQSLQGTA